ncbi:MAG: Ig-like domain-containing protein [Vicinamibacterales bacterium]
MRTLLRDVLTAWRGRRGAARAVLVALLASAALGSASLHAAPAAQSARFLAKEDILLYGLGLKIEPAQQTVPKDIATIVSTMFVAPQVPGNLPPFAPDAVVKATLRGPTFPTPIELTVKPNTPFNIPPLTVAGKHTLDNIRMISNGEVVLRGTPESAVIDVIDRLLITEVTARPLTAAEIREKGLVFDKSSFQAYSFAAAFAIEDKKVPINFTVVLPTLQSAEDVTGNKVTLPGIGSQPGLPSLQTVIPDSLKRLQTQIPNLNVQGFTLTVPEVKGQNFFVPPIPGVVVIPGDIGFLNQFFSVMLMVGNVAPAGSNLVVTDLKAEIVLPPGVDTVVGSPDDPLRMGRTERGEVLRVQPVVQPGPDGKLGTADDVYTLGPGESGNAEFLVEGRREGSHIIEMEITGTLLGLPIGPVTVRGRAAGAVLVRNPTFTLTFTHPEVVTAGEAYTLDVAVTNTGESPANLVSLNLYPRVVSGATIIGEPTRLIDTIAAGDSESVSFDLIAKVSGKVTAATLDSDENVTGRFALKTSVGELGVPLSPDSLVLPKEAGSLPADLRSAAIALLGKAYAVATAPGAALPKDIKRFSKKLIWDRAIEVAAAGLRLTLHEPLRDDATQLLMDFMGSNYGRLADRVHDPDDLAFARTDFAGFDDLRRRSVRGDVFAQAVAALMKDDLSSNGPAAFHHDLAQKISYRPGHISVLISSMGPLPFSMSLVDGQGHRLGGTSGTAGKVLKEIPFGDYLSFADSNGAQTAQLAVIAAPDSGDFTIKLERMAGVPDIQQYTLSVVVPDAQGTLRQFVFNNANGAQAPTLAFGPSDPYRLSVDAGVPSGAGISASVVPVTDPPPSIVSVVQQGQADQVCVDVGKTLGLWAPGRIVAVLFSEEVTLASVQDKLAAENISHYLMDGNKVVGVALQPDGRIAFVALRDPVGPFNARTLTISDVADLRGQAMASQSAPIEITVEDLGGVVSGRVLRADGSPVPYASMRLFYGCPGADDEVHWIGISSKNADEQGNYSWDYVLRAPRVLAVDPETDEFRDLRFSVARNGQRLNVDIVMIGRGTLQGRTLGEDGKPLKETAIRITSLTDHSAYAATSDAEGRFTVARVPVGNIFVEAVNPLANAQVSISENIPFAGATTTRDFVLLTEGSPQDVVLKKGTITGHVLRSPGTASLAGLPVVVYYTGLSQPGVGCPSVPGGECPVAIVTTDADGAFTAPGVPSGRLRVTSFDQTTLQEGEASLELAADGVSTVNIVIFGGVGTVKGIVLDPLGAGVPGAQVGGGLSLVTTDGAGRFTLPDVPLGRRTIVAVSDTLATSGRADVDVTRVGEEVAATIVLDAVGAVAGTLFLADGNTVVPGIAVYLYKLPIERNQIEIVGQATSDANGHFQMAAIPIGTYKLTAFTPDFSDGNLLDVTVKFNGQKVKADLKFRGGNGGGVNGVVLDASNTPVKARVSLSGEKLVVAGGRVGVDFQYVSNFQIVDTNFSTGQFSMQGLWPGSFTIRAAGQFSPDPIALEATMPSPTVMLDMTLKLQPTSTVGGRVLNPDGTPVGAGVIVKYKSDAFKTFCSESSIGELSCTTIPQGIQEAVAVTDTDGSFSFAIVNAGNYTLTAFEHADFTGRTARLRGSVRAGETADVEIKLLGLADLVVRVLASDAQTLIGGAKVEVRQIDYPYRSLVLFTPAAGPDLGVARFSGGDAFTEGPFVVTATGLQTGGFAGVASGRIVNDGEAVALNIYLATATGSVHGLVRRPDGSPAAFAEVIISNADGAIGFNVTDADGHYSQDLIPLGPFTVDAFEASTAGHGAASGQIFLAGQDVPANITEDALAVVTGRVVESGSLAPLKGWRVSFSQQTRSGRSIGLSTTSSVDGTFSFPGAAVGTFTLIAQNPSVQGQTQAQGEITQAGQAVDVPLVVTVQRPVFGSVEGVVSFADGTPAGNAKVCLNTCEPGARAITAAADGTFVLDQLSLGRVLLVAQPQTGFESGSALASIGFDGDVATVRIVLAGVSQISGTVLFNGSPSPGARVSLLGIPLVRRDGFADASGHFVFPDVSSRSFTITASAAPGFTTKGVVSERLNPGESKQVTIVLEPTGSLSGRVLLEGTGGPAGGITSEVVIEGKHFFTETASDGTFAFETLPLGVYKLSLEDPIGTGLASRTGTLAGLATLGDITLDASAPVVAQMTPAPSATGVPKNSAIRIVMSEPVDPATVNGANVTLSDGSGLIGGSVVQSDGDTTLTFTPFAALSEQTKYSLRVKLLADRVGHVMRTEFVAGFTTADTIAPSTLETSPSAGTTGASIYTPIRLAFNEAIDPAKFRTPTTLTLSSSSGPVAGRLDFLFGNTVVVFTPNLPLAPGAAYRVQSPAAADVSANVQLQGLDYTFTTTDGTPPSIVLLKAAGNGSVIENTATSVTATVGAFDVAFVDFFLNDQFAGTLPAPFVFSFQAGPSLGTPGTQVKVSAIATDTSGTRGPPLAIFVPITLDQPPVATVLVPAGGLNPANGEHVDVTVRATDDVGVTQVSFKAETGKAADAATRPVAPPVTDRAEAFGFIVPASAIPGSSIAIQGSAIDTKGQVVNAAPVFVTVRDAVPPTVTITGATSGTKVRAGQQTTVVVSVQDAGGIRSITFKASGVAALTQTRIIDPPQTSIVTSFTVSVPAGAVPPQSLTLDATAEDRAGNVGSAARVILPVGDNVAPTLTSLRTDTGRLQIVRGRSVTIVVDAEDDLGVSEIGLQGSGAFTVTDAKPIAPPLGTAQTTFTIQVPANAVSGSVLNLQATAVDLAGNPSTPASLALTVTALPEISFGPSLIMEAGESKELTLQLSEAAPASGLRVDFSTDPGIAATTPFLLFAEGQSDATITVTGVATGTAFISALIDGVQRGSATAVVQGGIVTGIVRDPQLQPVAGARVTSSYGDTVFTAETDQTGRYRLQGVPGPGVEVRVLKDVDPSTRLLGFASGSMNRRNGFVTLNVVLLAAGTIHGPVLLADGVTPAPDGVRVDLFEANSLQFPISSTFSLNGAYEFPLVAVGKYVVDSSDTHGNRGRVSTEVASSGQDVTAPVAFLGRGSVTVTVRDGGGNLVNGAVVTVFGYSVFGAEPPVTGTAVDGTFTVQNLPIGTFQVQARDPATNQGGSVGGQLTTASPDVTTVVTLAGFAGIQGTVYRSDGTTTVSGATVTAFGNISTVTDTQGHYALSFLPLGTSAVLVREPATRGKGQGAVTLSQQGETKTVDVTLYAQGTLVVTVQSANGVPVPNAEVIVSAGAGAESDVIFAQTGADGRAVVEHVVVGPFNVRAISGILSGVAPGVLTSGEQRAVLVQLQATASIAGVVKAPNDAPVTGGTVALNSGFGSLTVPIGTDGTFRADNLVFGSYVLTARDTENRVRAHVNDPIVLAVPNQLAQTSMKFVGLGTVDGRVINPDGSSAIGLSVTLFSLNPEFGGYRSGGTTNNGGFYAATNLPVGDFTISVANPLLHLRGEATGTIAQDGSAPTIDILLQNNLVDLPLTRWDANNFVFDVQRDGSILRGMNDVFGGLYAAQTWGGMQLDVIAGGTPTRFTGASFGAVEDKSREVAVHQDNVGGLSVSRKIFVPSAGYFARYLELLTNPTEASVTVDVRVSTSILESNGVDLAPSVIATSSGDDVIDVTSPSAPDRWVVVDDLNAGDPFATAGLPATAFVFDGPAATRGASAAAFLPPDPLVPLGPRQLRYQWSSITIPAGGTVALMHFAVQQTSRPAAQGAAERLVQMPPEALAGLNADELLEIQNFAVPGDGVSALVPLAPLTGSIAGRALASDASTAVAGVPVRFQSNNVLFGRTYQTTSAADGSFAFVSTTTDNGTSRSLPAEGFTLRADHPTLGAQASSPAVGAFAVGSLSAQQDVVFSNTGVARGIVRLNGAPLSGATVAASGPFGNTTVNFTTQSLANGSYLFPLLPAGVFTLTATSAQPGGTVQATGTASVAGGQTSLADLGLDTIAPQVSITSPAQGASIDPRIPLEVTVQAADVGGVVQMSFGASGVASAAETRTVAPAAASRTESFPVPFAVLPPTGGTLTLTASARDGAANQGNATSVVLSVRDVVSPDVVAVTPVAGLFGVEPDASLTVRFSEPVDRSSVTGASLRLTRGGTPVAVSLIFSDGDRTVALVAPPLALNTTFVIEATTQITDIAGNALSSPLASTFKTKSPDTTPPRVSTMAPANGAVNVPVGSDIRVTFSEPIEPTTITPASFRVSVSGAPVAGHFTFANGNATVRFAPDAPLPFDAVVVTELTSSIADLFENALVDGAGNAIVTPLTFTFVTGTFGITSPTQGSEVLENAPLSLEAKATASLNVATMTFAVNGQALPAVTGPPFTTTFNVGAAATTPTLTIVATGRNAGGSVVATDQVVVSVLAGLRVRARLVGVPVGGTGQLRLWLPSGLSADLPVQLSVVDAAIATVPSSVALVAGQTELIVPVTGVSTGATSIRATSARGNTWAIASVSPAVSKTMSTDAAEVGVVVVPTRLLGQVFTPVNGHQPVVLPLLSAPAVTATPVSITSSDSTVASVPDAVVIAQGETGAPMTIVTGAQGTATLTIRAGNAFGQVTVIVGNPPAGTEPPILAAPVGVVILVPPSGGRLFTASSALTTFGLTLLSSAAASSTPVAVTSSNPAIATVSGSVTIAAGSRSANVTLSTGTPGTATLTFTAGNESREFTVVVGPPEPGTEPPVLARPVGVVAIAASSLGQLFTSPSAQSVLTVQLLSTPAGAATPVTVSSSDPSIADVAGPVVIAGGAQTAAMTIVTGAQGTATLTFRAGTQTRQLTIVVGPPALGSEPLVVAQPVGTVVLQQHLVGTVFTPVGGQSSVNVTLLSALAGSPTTFTVTSTDANVASVSGAVVVPAGGLATAIHIVTGGQGVATLTLRAGSNVSQIVVVVGTPPAELLPVIAARIVGVEVKQ